MEKVLEVECGLARRHFEYRLFYGDQISSKRKEIKKIFVSKKSELNQA